MLKGFSLFSLQVLLVSLAFSCSAKAIAANGQTQIAQLPLGEQVQDDKAKVQDDKARLREDQASEQKGEQATQQYIQTTEQWIQQADAEKQAYESKLNAAEAGKSKASLAKLINTPGNELYILNTWLKNEAALEAQANRNLETAEGSINQQRSALETDKQQVYFDNATAQHDQGMYRDEMNSHDDLVRQAQNARYMGDRNGLQRGRYYTNYDKSAYDAGDYHP